VQDEVLPLYGKGGVGKTSLAAATGVKLTQLGYRTLVMSIDPSASWPDSFDLDSGSPRRNVRSFGLSATGFHPGT